MSNLRSQRLEPCVHLLMASDMRPIGVFDSGIGGLTVLRQLLRTLPSERYVYLGDTARVPYGNKSSETVQRYARECTNFLLTHNVKLIVVACNTASALALDAIRELVSIPVIGMIAPAAQHALETSRSGRIGVIGTRATISSNAYAATIRSLAEERYDQHPEEDHRLRSLELVSRPCPLFVPLVEEGWVDHPATRQIADVYLKPLLSQGIDTLVLGCTHYPLLSPLLADLAPGVSLIDCGHAAARLAAEVLDANPTSTSILTSSTVNNSVSVYLTDYTPAFQTIAKEFLGVTVEEPVRASLNELS